MAWLGETAEPAQTRSLAEQAREGFRLDGDPEQVERVETWLAYLEP